MIQLILMLTLVPSQSPRQLTQTEPCVWPNRCALETTAQVAQQEVPIITCQWPNTCAQETPVR